MSRKFLSFLVENIYNFFDLFHTWRLRKFYSEKDFDLVIDVGSHKGEFINRVINKYIPIYSFEPQRQVRKSLKKIHLKIMFLNIMNMLFLIMRDLLIYTLII